MEQPNPNKSGLLLRYQLALLNFTLPNDEKPILETQFYALAHPEDQNSPTMTAFIDSYLKKFARSAFAFREPNANTSEIRPEFEKAIHKLFDDKESLRKLLQMHQHAKEQSVKQSPRKQ